MNLNILEERQKVLQLELENSKKNVLLLTEQLDQAKLHLNTVFGHISEVAFLIHKEKEEVLKERDNGKIINETEECFT